MAGVQLDEDVGNYLQERAARGGHADISAYLRDLIRRDEASANRLKAELQKGLDSGISPLSFDEVVEKAFERVRRKCA